MKGLNVSRDDGGRGRQNTLSRGQVTVPNAYLEHLLPHPCLERLGVFPHHLRLEDVAHSKHNGAGAQPLVLTAGPKTRAPRCDRPGDRDLT